ncbi:MAG: gliding motility lipoprotein GldB [Flammeovirgaceae bacterium]|nr:gliding motility lipoprotein GldB [Flammeovirgaceae bacterium]
MKLLFKVICQSERLPAGQAGSRRLSLGFFLNLSLFLFVISCSPEYEECVIKPEASKIQVDYVALTDSIASISTKQELVDLLSRYPVVRDVFLRRSEYPGDSVFINELFRRFTNPYFDTLVQESKRVFANESMLKAEFDEAFTNLKFYYPDFKPPKIQTLVTGLDNDLLVTDSLIIVGIDYYLGPGARFRPKMYDYLLRQYEKETIVPSCMLIYGISSRFNKTNMEDKTVLADMVAYGKAFYFAKHMQPCKPDSVLAWYSAEEINGARENENLIWFRLVEDQVLYSTSKTVKQKFLEERPKTLEVGDKCPGRIAQWTGWQIVNSYMNAHPATSLPDLMVQSSADRLFKESKYKPQK